MNGARQEEARDGKNESMKAQISAAFEVEQIGETVVLTPSEDMGEFHSEAVAEGLRNVREHLENHEFKNVVLDFERTDYFGSTVLGEFTHLWKEVREREGLMAFCGLSDNEKQILKVTKLDHLWPICGSLDEALCEVSETDDAGTTPRPD